jgi:hypothetical protein
MSKLFNLIVYSLASLLTCNGWWRMAPRPSATCVGPGGGAMGDLADEGEPGATVLFA